ncbi:MAG: hypothetical protein LBM73_03620 [Candidatus Nomurabacteria bacterium]|nr:hypothetical protein [Candidatus Nomurabacteria bacterium]
MAEQQRQAAESKLQAAAAAVEPTERTAKAQRDLLDALNSFIKQNPGVDLPSALSALSEAACPKLPKPVAHTLSQEAVDQIATDVSDLYFHDVLGSLAKYGQIDTSRSPKSTQ